MWRGRHCLLGAPRASLAGHRRGSKSFATVIVSAVAPTCPTMLVQQGWGWGDSNWDGHLWEVLTVVSRDVLSASTSLTKL